MPVFLKTADSGFMTSSHSVNIFQFNDPRLYLEKVLSEKKGQNSLVSLRSFAKKAGFKSPSTLSMILGGKRKFTLAAAEKIAKALSLSARKRRYLMALSKLDTAQGNQERAQTQELLVKLRSTIEEVKIEYGQYQFLSVWYIPVIYVLVDMTDFDSNPLQIAKRLGRGVSPAQAQAALNSLLQLSLIEIKEGRYAQTKGPITTGSESRESAIYQYHHKLIKIGVVALELPRDQREINGLSVAINPTQLPAVKEKLRVFFKDLNEFLSQGSQSGEVYQFNCQLFPLTQAVTKGERK